VSDVTFEFSKGGKKLWPDRVEKGHLGELKNDVIG
jgi:hypothetical protein